MRAGKLRQPVELFRPSRSTDSEGSVTTALETAGVVRAEIREVRPSELARAQAIDAQCDTIMVTRFRPDLAPLTGVAGSPSGVSTSAGPLWTARVNGMDFDIVGAADPDGRRREIVFYIRRRGTARAA